MYPTSHPLLASEKGKPIGVHHSESIFSKMPSTGGERALAQRGVEAVSHGFFHDNIESKSFTHDRHSLL